MARSKLANFLISIFVDTNIICIVDCSCEYTLKFFIMAQIKATGLETPDMH